MSDCEDVSAHIEYTDLVADVGNAACSYPFVAVEPYVSGPAMINATTAVFRVQGPSGSVYRVQVERMT